MRTFETPAANSGLSPSATLWGSRQGWFSASFGPFRRFWGGDTSLDDLYTTHPLLGRHLSLFEEAAALGESLRWLQQLQFQRLERSSEPTPLDEIREFVNSSRLLPHGVLLERVASDGVYFRDGSGTEVPANELSDGYRSVLSLVLELLRQMTTAYDAAQLFDPSALDRVAVPGVVLIDEIDAHLHPSWQRQIGCWFREHFPEVQFIVSTHSPLICQPASSVYRLPTPGTNPEAGFVTGQALDRLRYGDVQEAYGTDLFGESVGRSEEGLTQLERLAHLNRKELSSGLSAAEQDEQHRLRGILVTESHRTAAPDGGTR